MNGMPDPGHAAFVVETEVPIAVDHPAFAGHFPGAPVLPGAWLLALVLQAVRADARLSRRVGATPCVEQVKFLHPVGPGQRIVLRLSAQERVHFEVICGSRCVARGRIAAGAAA